MYADQIIEARALATPYGQNITAMDKTPAIQVQGVPALGGGTEYKMKITTDGIRLKVDDDTPSGVNAPANMTSSGWLTFASQTNIGQMVDQLNSCAGLRAFALCALRGDLASNLLAAAETVISNAAGKTFYWDSKDETLICAGGVISGEKFVNNGKNGHVKDAVDGCENTLLYLQVDMVDSDHTLRFYSGAQGSAEVQIGSAVSITGGANTEFGDKDPDDPYISAARGERLIYRITSLTPAKGTPTRVHALGKTAVLKNDRIVDSINFTA